MKKTLLFALLLTSSLIAPFVRAEPTSAELADELLKVLELEKNMSQYFAMAQQSMAESVKQTQAMMGVTNASAEAEMAKSLKIIQEALSWENLKADFIALYSETFTAEELQGILDFYKSPAGQKFIVKQPELMQKSMQISQKLMARIMPRLQEVGTPPPAPQP
jgi:hypothetical protein